MALRIDLGSGNLKGSFGFGKREDYTYDVPNGAIHVSLDAEDKSSDSLNIGSGNGKVALKWDREGKKARVHAWVNGAAGPPPRSQVDGLCLDSLSQRRTQGYKFNTCTSMFSGVG